MIFINEVNVPCEGIVLGIAITLNRYGRSGGRCIHGLDVEGAESEEWV